MKINVHICDLCRTEGTVRLAKGKYFADETERWFDACGEHSVEVKGYGLTIINFDELGNVDTRHLSYE